MAQYQGQIAAWQASKGFGFIQPNGTGKQVFFHLQAWLGNRQGIQAGQVVKYDLTKDTQGRVCAINVSPIQALTDGMNITVTLLRWLPEKKMALLQHEDHPDVSVILPQSAVVGELPVVGQAVQGVLRLHSSGHWVLTQAQVLVKQALKPKQEPKPIATAPPKKSASAHLLGNWYEGMALQGRLEEWQDDKGYGFIAVEGASNRVFFHISDYMEMDGRPHSGMKLGFQLAHSEGKWRAQEAQCLSMAKFVRHKKNASGRSLAGEPIKIVLAVVMALVFFALLQHFQPMLAVWCGLWSVASFFSYFKDKQAALRQNWRTPEKQLHLFDLLGGWPGGLIARQLWRHKTSKTEFVVVFWITVIINCIVTLGLMRHVDNYLSAWL